MSLDYGLPNDLHEMRFVDCKFLKPNYISHMMKCESFHWIRRYSAIAKFTTQPHNNRNSYIVSIQLFLILRINIIF